MDGDSDIAVLKEARPNFRKVAVARSDRAYAISEALGPMFPIRSLDVDRPFRSDLGSR